MDLKQLQALGAFVPRTLFKRELTVTRPILKPADEWADPGVPESTDETTADSLTTWIRKRSSADFLEMVKAPAQDKAHIAILRCVCLEDGSEVFESLEQAKQIQEWLFMPLMLAVNDVNGFGLKNSLPRTKSGLSSPSSSAAPSRKLKPASRRRSSAPSGSRTGPAAAP